jgi:hypothetical protein
VIHKNGKHSTERRRHPRFKVVGDLVEPIVLRYVPDKSCKPKAKDDIPKFARSQPAILTSLSAGGVSLITFLAPPHTRLFKMALSIPGLNSVPVQGKVVRVHQKGETYIVGIEFTRIAKKYQKLISQMANDDVDCNTRISLGLPEACVPACKFHFLCTKAQKSLHWPPKA